jgi:predicted XRE-type DNA-binding protein
MSKTPQVYTDEEEEFLRHTRKMLRARMKHSKLKQAQIAQRMGVTRARVCQIMGGHPDEGARDLNLITMRRALRACGFDLLVVMQPTEDEGAPKDSPLT